MIKTALIGLGAMGAGMAANLHANGCLVGAWNRTRTRGIQAAAQYGFVLSPSLADAVNTAELVLISVSADQDLLAIAEQLVASIKPGTIVLDTSTISMATAQQAASLFAAHHCHFLDGPVSGGPEGANQGSLAMMVGGDSEILQSIQSTLQHITRQIVHMGPVGSGQATKAVNQVMVAGINQAVTESLAFAEDAGLELDKVLEVVGAGAAGNWFMHQRGPSMCQGSFTPGFRVALHTKDLKICQQMLAKRDIRLPLVEMTLVHYQRLLAAGFGDEDISALLRIKQALFTQQ